MPKCLHRAGVQARVELGGVFASLVCRFGDGRLDLVEQTSRTLAHKGRRFVCYPQALC